MNDRMAIEFIHGSHDAVLEFLFGCDADVAQHRAGELGEEALDEIEPETMLGCEDEFEGGWLQGNGVAPWARGSHDAPPMRSPELALTPAVLPFVKLCKSISQQPDGDNPSARMLQPSGREYTRTGALSQKRHRSFLLLPL